MKWFVPTSECELERDYTETGLRRSRFLSLGQPRKAKREYDRQIRILKEGLRRLPDRGEGVLKKICNTAKDIELQISAASDLFAIDEDFGVKRLELIARSEMPGSFTAEVTLQEWRKGNLRKYLE